MKIYKLLLSNLFLLTIISLVGCQKELLPTEYKTENVIIIVFDGARYTETWGDPTHHNIPSLATNLAPEGVVLTNFQNKGQTVTVPGHSALLNGNYELLLNNGKEVPTHPSILQEWLFQSGQTASSAWIISSKDKLEALKSCRSLNWFGRKRPLTNCGVKGKGLNSGYRDDDETVITGKNILFANHPRITLISLDEPDVAGHAGDWNEYLDAIQKSDSNINELWKFINNNPYYKGKTTVFITNDHGRHSDGVSSGFVGHGDDCEGCTNLFFYATGPDFKKNVILNHPYELIDVSVTAAKLLGFTMIDSKGVIMEELFQ